MYKTINGLIRNCLKYIKTLGYLKLLVSNVLSVMLIMKVTKLGDFEFHCSPRINSRLESCSKINERESGIPKRRKSVGREKFHDVKIFYPGKGLASGDTIRMPQIA